MNVEQMTNEELARYLSSTMSGRVVFAIPVKIGDEGVEFKRYAYTHLAHEAARRLRNSIPKPDMTIEQGDIMYINGTYIGIVDEQCITNVRNALGLEGGGDEC